MNKVLRSVLTMLAIVSLLNLAGPLTVWARARNTSDDQNSKKQKTKKDDAEKTSHNQRMFLKIKAESEDWYKNDPEFRNEVDEAYRNLQRDHSEYAFYMNTHDQNDSQTTFQGDKLKVRDTLYDNPLVQDYVNRLGHSLVPAGSTHLYAFKVTMDPIPEARSLSTGTVYVSTGLISAADSEAQLAYVLSHEIAHIEKEHWLEDVMVDKGRERYNQKQEQKRNLITGIGSIAAGPLARIAGAGALNALLTSELVQMGLPTLVKIAVPDAVFTWDKDQEDEADKLAIHYMLNRNYDPREVPRFYTNLKLASTRDQRASLGFMATASRVSERIQSINDELGGLPAAQLMSPSLLAGASDLMLLQAKRQAEQQSMALIQNATAQVAQAASQAPGSTQPPPGPAKAINLTTGVDRAVSTIEREINGPEAAAIRAKVTAGELIGTEGEFLKVMAELKRDNGVRAYYYDMFQVARDNLAESLAIRSDDPLAHFYYAKTIKLTARNLAEKQEALSEFTRAIDYDKREVVPEARLHHALAMIEMADPTRQSGVISDLKDYVTLYQREHGGALPPNMDIIYDYMQDAGEVGWWASPTVNISDQNIAPISIKSGAAARSEPVAQPVQAPARVQNDEPSTPRNTRRRRRPQ